MDLDDRQTAAALDELVRQRVLRCVEGRVDFTHDRVREVVRRSLLPARVTLLHGGVAGALEALFASDLDHHAARLGTHYLGAEVWDRAARYLRRAGARP